jgi:hypothetical protein
VPRRKIERLYGSDAEGIYDEALIDDVGTTLWVRCRSILEIHEAKQGRVRCPRCARRSVDTYIPRQSGRARDPRDEVLACPACGWQITWEDYTKSYKRKQLNAGGAVDVFQHYVDAYPRARTPREKMLAIDRLIHEFHYSLKNHPDQPTRPVAVNLIQGKLSDVEAFLDELTYGEAVPVKARDRRAAWRENRAARDRWLADHRRRLEAKRNA